MKEGVKKETVEDDGGEWGEEFMEEEKGKAGNDG